MSNQLKQTTENGCFSFPVALWSVATSQTHENMSVCLCFCVSVCACVYMHVCICMCMCESLVQLLPSLSKASVINNLLSVTSNLTP